MTQPHLDWSRDVSLPVSGRTPRARHASATGAQMAAERRGKLALDYRALLIEAGPMTDHEAAKVLGVSLSSIQPTRGSWGDRVTDEAGFQAVTWPSGRSTKRVRWSWRK